MFYRRKILLALLKIFGGKLPKIDFQKYLFLLNVNKTEPFFDFIPYKYGCFSFQANQDMSTLTKYNLVEETEKYWRLKGKTDYLNQLKTGDKILIANFYQKHKSLKGNELVKYVYELYPYYAINSSISEKILDNKKYKAVVDSRPSINDYTLFTIGYEGKTVEHFTNMLIKEDIKVLCDIRKNALSMKYGFSKNQIKFIVENSGIKYIHIPGLGIESNKRKKLNSKKEYENLFRDYEKKTLPCRANEIEQLCEIFNTNKRIALMCFEADHKNCHRSRTLNALVNKLNRELAVKHL
jgi:uncharacterized protein (DUF488 family)